MYALQGTTLPARRGRKRTTAGAPATATAPQPDAAANPATAPATEPTAATAPHAAAPAIAPEPPVAQLPVVQSATAAPLRVAFRPEHPLYMTHVLQRQPRPRYVLPTGSLPRRPTDSSSPADADQYYAFVLGSFKTHRGMPVPPGRTPSQAYEEWWSELSTTDAGRRYQRCVTAVLDNIEQDHAARARHTEEYNRRRRERAAATADPGGYKADDDGGDSDTEAAPGRFEPHPDTQPAADAQVEHAQLTQPRPTPTIGLDLGAVPLTSLFDRTTPEGLYAYEAAVRCSLPTRPVGHGTTASGLLRRASPADAAALHEAAQRLKRYTSMATAPGQPAAAIDAGAAADRRLRLECSSMGAIAVIIEVDGQPPETIPPGHAPPDILLPRPPSIEDTIRLYTLAPDQAVPFILMARYFNRRNEPDPGRPPREMVVGPPGTGKSQFAQALQWYTFQHGQPDWVATCAYAWSAAAAYHTATHRSLSTHSMFGISAMGEGGSNRPRRGANVSLQVRTCTHANNANTPRTHSPHPNNARLDASTRLHMPPHLHLVAHPLCPRPNLEPATILMPAPGIGTEPKAIRRNNIPVGDWHAYTDYAVQGRTFGEETWVIDLTLPPRGIKRATLYVLLTRFKSLDHIRLLRPLYTTPAAHKKVITAFLKATHLEPDLAAELRLLSAAAAATRNRYPAEFRLAEELDAQHHTAGAAS
ncbi:hypothetical protein PLESTM_001610800 [Pleodorina starrii]|nr:hypothetical protein PLESTM_001610800 [Pleodorina starrii]